MLFLSHSGADSAAASELARRLRESGLQVWLDPDYLQSASGRTELLR